MATSTFDTGLPSIRQIQTFIRDQQAVEVKLTTGDELVGALIWQDVNSICIKAGEQNAILMRGAIAYVKSSS
ncbi:MAG: RNA-binding protein hfq [Phormidesmis sp.]